MEAVGPILAEGAVARADRTQRSELLGVESIEQVDTSGLPGRDCEPASASRKG